MLQSQLFTNTLREVDKDEKSINAVLLIKGGFIDKLASGVYTYLPLGLRVLDKINNIIREEMNKIGGQEILMPALTPKENWVTTKRWNGFDVLYKLKTSDEREYAIAPTHEEIITPLLKKFISSYKDLPKYVYQIQTKFRNEQRPKSGLLRTREFLMKDLYSFHKDEKDLENYYQKVIKAYFSIYNRLDFKDNVYLTYASGGTFSEYSHEFQVIVETGEDTIYLCKKCKIAVNKELVEGRNPACPECNSSDLKEFRAIEVGNIFKLGTKFSEAFNFNYTDKNGKSKPVIMGCYGFGPSRAMGSLVEVFHDDDGIIWPRSVAPYQIHLLDFRKNRDNEFYKILQKQKFEVIYDERDISPGVKLKDADLIGIPYRLVISDKLGDKVELKKRDEDDIEICSVKEVVNILGGS